MGMKGVGERGKGRGPRAEGRGRRGGQGGSGTGTEKSPARGLFARRAVYGRGFTPFPQQALDLAAAILRILDEGDEQDIQHAADDGPQHEQRVLPAIEFGGLVVDIQVVALLLGVVQHVEEEEVLNEVGHAAREFGGEVLHGEADALAADAGFQLHLVHGVGGQRAVRHVHEAAGDVEHSHARAHDKEARHGAVVQRRDLAEAEGDDAHADGGDLRDDQGLFHAAEQRDDLAREQQGDRARRAGDDAVQRFGKAAALQEAGDLAPVFRLEEIHLVDLRRKPQREPRQRNKDQRGVVPHDGQRLQEAFLLVIGRIHPLVEPRGVHAQQLAAEPEDEGEHGEDPGLPEAEAVAQEAEQQRERAGDRAARARAHRDPVRDARPVPGVRRGEGQKTPERHVLKGIQQVPRAVKHRQPHDLEQVAEVDVHEHQRRKQPDERRHIQQVGAHLLQRLMAALIHDAADQHVVDRVPDIGRGHELAHPVLPRLAHHVILIEIHKAARNEAVGNILPRKTDRKIQHLAVVDVVLALLPGKQEKAHRVISFFV